MQARPGHDRRLRVGRGHPCPPGQATRRHWAILGRSSRQPLLLGFRFGFAQGDGHLALEQAPKAQVGPLQPQVLIRAPALPLPPAKHPRVPVQPLQIQQPLSSAFDAATDASATRCSCTPPRCWLAPPGSTPPPPADTTHASSGRASGRGAAAPAGPPGDSLPPRPGPRPASAADAATTSAPRRLADSSATASRPSWPCNRSRNVNDSGAWSSPRTLDHSEPDSNRQGRGHLRFGPRPVVEFPIRTEQAQRRLGLLPTRLALLIPLEGRRRLLPGRAGRSGRAPRVAALPLGLVDRSAGGLGLLPEPLHSVPQRLEHPPGLPLGVEDIQPLLQRDRLGRRLPTILLERGDARLESGPRVADDRSATHSRASIPPTRSPPDNCPPSSR